MSITDATKNKFSGKIMIIQKPAAKGKEKVIEDFIILYGEITEEKQTLVNSWVISQHYKQFRDTDFFPDMLRYWPGNIVKLWCLNTSQEKLEEIRKDIGPPKPVEGSFRESLVPKWKEIYEKAGVLDNGIHCSDSFSEGEREYGVWFSIPPLYRNLYDKEYEEYLESIHTYLWKELSSFCDKNGWYLQFAGSPQNGTAVLNKPAILSYRLLAPVVTGKEIIPAGKFNRIGTDVGTGTTYIKNEYPFNGGKADITLVPTEQYRHKISTSHLIDIMPEEWKNEIRKKKSNAWSVSKEEYERVKQEIRNEINSKFKLFEKL